MTMTSRCLLAIVGVVAIAGCDIKTEKQVYDEAKPVADVLRAKVVAAAGIIDKKPPTPASSACKAPKKLTFDPKSDAHDTDFIMLEEAKRGGGKPDDKNKDENLDLHFATNPFPRLLRGTSPNSIYPSYTLTDTAKTDMIDTIRRGKNVKNVIIVRERSGVFDYFLVDLAPASPAIGCAGTFTPTADPTLGAAHTQEYVTITTNLRTGKEIKREKSTVTTDPTRAALYADARTQLGIHMQKELGIAAIE
jgi:hypothetical protein